LDPGEPVNTFEKSGRPAMRACISREYVMERIITTAVTSNISVPILRLTHARVRPGAPLAIQLQSQKLASDPASITNDKPRRTAVEKDMLTSRKRTMIVA